MRNKIIGIFVVVAGIIALIPSVGHADCNDCRSQLAGACERTPGCSYEVNNGVLFGTDPNAGISFNCSPSGNCISTPISQITTKKRPGGDAVTGILKNAPIRTGGTVSTHPSTGPASKRVHAKSRSTRSGRSSTGSTNPPPQKELTTAHGKH
jgi:hypothetical protein